MSRCSPFLLGPRNSFPNSGSHDVYRVTQQVLAQYFTLRHDTQSALIAWRLACQITATLLVLLLVSLIMTLFLIIIICCVPFIASDFLVFVFCRVIYNKEPQVYLLLRQEISLMFISTRKHERTNEVISLQK